MGENLAREERLRGRDAIGRLFREGARGSSGPILVRALPNRDGITRVAAIAGKKLGCAVKRNRMRRLLRAAYRARKAEVPPGWDLALVAKNGLLETAWLDLTRNLDQAIGRAATGCSGRPPPRPSP